MGAALRTELEAMAGIPLVLTPRPVPETLPAGIPEFGEIPRGCLSEIHGPASSGRTSMAVALMAEITAREEFCALIDTADSFDPAGAANAGVRLDRLLWVRCGGDAERALKVADLLIQAGGFGLILFDLGDTPLRQARRISLTSWFRLRRAVENTPSTIVVIAQEPMAKTCASLVVEMHRGASDWSGRLLRGISSGTRRTKPRGEMRHVRLHTRLG
jgi:recombination protein RecA